MYFYLTYRKPLRFVLRLALRYPGSACGPGIWAARRLSPTIAPGLQPGYRMSEHSNIIIIESLKALRVALAVVKADTEEIKERLRSHHLSQLPGPQ